MMMIYPVISALLVMIVLHGPDGREIDVNKDEITSLNCKVPGPNKFYVENANAVVSLTDGKNIAVRETCTEIRELLKEKSK